MARRKTQGEQFIEYMQRHLGDEVTVPTVATDVMRSVQFPGLQSKGEDEVDYASFDLPGAMQEPPMQEASEGAAPGPMAPAGDPGMGPILDEDE